MPYWVKVKVLGVSVSDTNSLKHWLAWSATNLVVVSLISLLTFYKTFIIWIIHCIVETDFIPKGMCEQVILNEEVENEKVKKHRKIISFGRYSMDR